MTWRTEHLADGVTLYCGDCREILPTLGKVDAVVTDPPYGMNYENWKGDDKINNDGTRASLRLYRAVIPACKTIPTLWFTRWDAWPDVWEIFAEATKINGLLVWDKGHNGMGNLKHWGSSYELIASCGPVATRGSRDGSVLKFKPVPPNARHHPNEKPIDLMGYLISKTTDDDNVVLDPFMGSGTTGVAAVQLDRNFIGIESDPAYFDIACRRIQAALDAPDMFVEPPKPAKQEAML